MSFKSFQASGSTHVELFVPSKYIILCGGVELHGYAVLTASYPSSPTSWIADAVPLHHDAELIVTVLALDNTKKILETDIIEVENKAYAEVWVPGYRPPAGKDEIDHTAKKVSPVPLKGDRPQGLDVNPFTLTSDQGYVALCGGVRVLKSCIALSTMISNETSNPAFVGWRGKSEHFQDVVICSLLVAKPRSNMSIKVFITAQGTWRIHLGDLGDYFFSLGYSTCQEPTARNTLLSSPSKLLTTHPRTAMPGQWRLHRRVISPEKLKDMSKTFCKLTKRQSSS